MYRVGSRAMDCPKLLSTYLHQGHASWVHEAMPSCLPYTDWEPKMWSFNASSSSNRSPSTMKSSSYSSSEPLANDILGGQVYPFNEIVKSGKLHDSWSLSCGCSAGPRVTTILLCDEASLLFIPPRWNLRPIAPILTFKTHRWTIY